MTLPSRRTLLLAFGATLLIVVPCVRVGGERSYCEGLDNAHRDERIVTKADEVSFDSCTMIDFGMTTAIRVSFDSGVLLLIIAAWSYGRDRRQARHQ